MGERMDGLLREAMRLRRESPRAPIDPAVGQELATRAIEQLRVEDLCDDLWAKTMTKPVDAAHTTEDAVATAAPPPPLQQSAELELGHCRKRAPPWRFYLRLQRNPIWRALARMRLVKLWDTRSEGRTQR